VTCPLPQFEIFAQAHAHHFLEFDLKPGLTAAEAVGAFRRLRTPDLSAGGVNLVIAFGADASREGGAVGRACGPCRVHPDRRRRRASRAGDPARCLAVDQRRRAGRDVAERACCDAGRRPGR
jgi:hypothetical protein